jgi:putative transposase
MVRPAVRRELVAWARAAYGVSERRACSVTKTARSTARRRESRRPKQEALKKRLKELAAVRVSYGYQRLHVLLRREGWPVNRKRVYRLYREEGLALRRKRPRRRKSAVVRLERLEANGPGERWAMDFIHDTQAGGEAIRVLAILDVFNRECVALEAKKSFRGADVATVLGQVGRERGLPEVIQCDQGTEFTSKAMDHWAYWNQVKLDFSRPGKPTDNAVAESFLASLRRECLTLHWFRDLEEARERLEEWREDYNNVRPHSSLGHVPPAHFGAGGFFTPGPERLQI